tara:strand:+ start:2569 stop:2808 length:240 start_codon:yes stop_codon:yes gene_type:complete
MTVIETINEHPRPKLATAAVASASTFAVGWPFTAWVFINNTALADFGDAIILSALIEFAALITTAATASYLIDPSDPLR